MWKNTKAEVGRVRKEKKTTEGKLEKKMNQKKDETRALKSKKSAKKYVFLMFHGSGGSRGKVAKAAGAARSTF